MLDDISMAALAVFQNYGEDLWKGNELGQVWLSSPNANICTASSQPCRFIITHSAHPLLVKAERACIVLSLLLSPVVVL